MDAFGVFVANELNTLVPVATLAVAAFRLYVRQQRSDVEHLFPDRGTRCFCRRQMRCGCPHGAAPVAGALRRCGVCREWPECDCLRAPMASLQAAAPRMPAELHRASAALRMLGATNRWMRDVYRENMAHVGMAAAMRTFRNYSRVQACANAHYVVVGRRVGCCVGECSRCNGDIHECSCSMFSCECDVCVWLRQVMDDNGYGDVDDWFRGQKPQRDQFRRLPERPRDRHRDQERHARYTELRRHSFERHERRAAPALRAEDRRERESHGLELFDASLDSDINSDEDADAGSDGDADAGSDGDTDAGAD